MTDTYRRKLVEVALPLDEINAASVADKKRKTGTIRNLHKWFAPAPLPAWRALLFAALVDDPEDEEKRAYLKDYEAKLITPADVALWERGASNAGYHYLGCAKTFALMGKAFAETLLKSTAP